METSKGTITNHDISGTAVVAVGVAEAVGSVGVGEAVSHVPVFMKK